jgi:hypothetical protein
MPLQLNIKIDFSERLNYLFLLAIDDSVTVSIGVDTNGVLIVIVFVSLDCNETLSDEKLIKPGKIIKSLYVKPSFFLNNSSIVKPSDEG